MNTDIPPAPQLAGLRLLLVDDSPLIRQITHGLLSDEGAEVSLAECGLEGVAKALAIPGYDLILMDVLMPDIDGLEATRRLRRQHVHTPVLALTARTGEADRQACLDAGMNGHVSKPVDTQELVKRILQHTGRGPATVSGTASSATPLSTASDANDAPLLDSAGALVRLAGNAAFLGEIQRNFRSNAAGHLSAAHALLANGAHAEAMRAMHTLKGLAGSVGAMRLHAAAQVAENHLRELAETKNTALLPKALRAIYAVEMGLAQVLDVLPVPPARPTAAATDATPPGRAPDAALYAAARRALTDLDGWLRQGNMRATDACTALVREFQPVFSDRFGDRLGPLQAAVSALDFARARAVCAALLAELPDQPAP